MIKYFDLFDNEISNPFVSTRKIMKLGKILDNNEIGYRGYFDIDNTPAKIKEEIMKIIDTLDISKIRCFPFLDKDQLDYLNEVFIPIEEMLNKYDKTTNK